MIKLIAYFLALGAAGLGGSNTVLAAPIPVRLGVNVAGDYHMLHPDVLHPGKPFYEYDAWFQAMDDLGVKFIDFNFLIGHYLTGDVDTTATALAKLTTFDAQMRAHGLQYLLSVELANWWSRLELAPGINEFQHPDGSHRWDLPLEWINLIQDAIPPETSALLGVNYDEGEHNQLVGNAYVADANPAGSFDVPYFLPTAGLTMEQAYDGLVEQCRRIRTEHYQGRARLLTEQVWPDMFPIFARAGWTLCPKMLKENLSSVNMAVALGAAIEYADQTDLWICNDLWKLESYPGWSPQALRSGLLMSYWLGATAIYVENVDYDNESTNPQQLPHPLASPHGSLLHWLDPDHYELTNHGLVVQDFFKRYVPTQPREISWRDYRPRLAIVRLPDGDWGQKGSGFRDRLLGNRLHPSDAISHEWLDIWPILTHGVARAGAISLMNQGIYPADDKTRDFFVPLDSVAVFDHHVQGPVLDSVECFVVCGHALSPETFEAIRQRVAQGATCIIARRLYAEHASGILPGDWLVVDDFKDPAIAPKLQPYLGPADVARFRFKGHTVEFRRGGEFDSITVDVIPVQNGADRAWLKTR